MLVPPSMEAGCPDMIEGGSGADLAVRLRKKV
jgi:hypothetical protein